MDRYCRAGAPAGSVKAALGSPSLPFETGRTKYAFAFAASAAASTKWVGPASGLPLSLTARALSAAR